MSNINNKTIEKYNIIRNSAKCNVCETEIESKYTHDFQWCQCKSIAVDGGKQYLRRIGNPQHLRDTSIINESFIQ